MPHTLIRVHCRARETSARYLEIGDLVAMTRDETGELTRIRSIDFYRTAATGAVEWWSLVGKRLTPWSRSQSAWRSISEREWTPSVWSIELARGGVNVETFHSDLAQFVMRSQGELERWELDAAVRRADEEMLAMVTGEHHVVGETTRVIPTTVPPVPRAVGGIPMGGDTAGRARPDAREAWIHESPRDSDNQE